MTEASAVDHHPSEAYSHRWMERWWHCQHAIEDRVSRSKPIPRCIRQDAGLEGGLQDLPVGCGAPRRVRSPRDDSGSSRARTRCGLLHGAGGRALQASEGKKESCQLASVHLSTNLPQWVYSGLLTSASYRTVRCRSIAFSGEAGRPPRANSYLHLRVGSQRKPAWRKHPATRSGEAPAQSRSLKDGAASSSTPAPWCGWRWGWRQCL